MDDIFIRLTAVVLLLVGISLLVLAVYLIFRGLKGGVPPSDPTQAMIRNAVQLNLPRESFLILTSILCIAGASMLVKPSIGASTSEAKAAAAEEKSAPAPSAPGFHTPEPTPAPTPVPTPVPTEAPAAGGPQVQITSPEPGLGITLEGGVLIKGTARDLGADTVWILDFFEGETPFQYYRVNPEPIPVRSDGTWMYRDAPLGDEEDPVGFEYTVVAVRATPECTEFLASAVPDENDSVGFGDIPDSCHVEDSVKVVKKA